MRPRKVLQKLGLCAVLAIFVIASALGFGITPGDWRRAVDFDRAVGRWQHDPDFRAVTFEYVNLGSRAMQARICDVRAKRAIIMFRKIPGLPDSIAANPTSQSHYDDFAAGPWRAYFHLSNEQDVSAGIALIEKLGANPTDDQIRQFLRGFHLPVPTVTDAGAVESVRSLLRDVSPDRPFTIRDKPFGLERLREADGYSFEQQLYLIQSLDKQLSQHDRELWRTKQVSDFLAGIWAQGYGQMYADGIYAVGILRIAGRIVCITMLLVGGAVLLHRCARE